MVMNTSDNILCMFSAELDTIRGGYQFRVPRNEVEIGPLESGGTYRVAILPPASAASTPRSDGVVTSQTNSQRENASGSAPVEEGEILEVEIEEEGDKGDGLAYVGPGFVLIVEGANVGETVTVEIDEVRDTFAFANVSDQETLA